MRPIIQVPRLNPINFRPNIQPDDNRIHSRGMLQDLYYNRIREWEDKYQWCLPFQNDDKIRLQFNISTDENVKLELINCYGQVEATYFAGNVFDLAGNNDKVTGAHLYNHYFQFSFTDIAQGVYYLLLTAGNVPLDTKQSLSEPIHIAPVHLDTQLVSYRGDHNTTDPVIFEQTNCIFYLRVPGIVKRALPDFDSNSYKNQANNTTQIYFKAGRTYEVFFDRIPDYLHDTLNFAIGLDYVTIDNVRFALDEGARWEEGVTDNAPLRSPSIVLRESDPHAGTIDRTVGPLLLAQLPKDYPYALQTLGMGIQSANISLLVLPRIIRSDSNRDSLLAFLQGLRAGLGLEGSFSIATNTFSYDLYYNNADNEIYGVASRTIAFPNISMGISANVLANQRLVFSFTQGLITVDWGDSSLPLNYSASSVGTNVAHNYNIGTYTAQVFGEYESFGANVGESGAITTITGLFPSRLKALNISGSRITTFNVNTLSLATNLAVLIIRQGILTTVSNLSAYVFYFLKTVSFSLNALGLSQVNALLISVNGNATSAGLTQGRLDLNSQTPPVTVTNISALQAKNNLQNNLLWTVNT